MTRVAVETLAVSSSRSECMVSGSRFTVSTLMSSFLRVTSLRPGTGETAWALTASPKGLVPGPALAGNHNGHPPGPWERGPATGLGPLGARPAAGAGAGGEALPTAILTAFAPPVEEEHEGDEGEGEQDAGPDGGSRDDAHRQHLCRPERRGGKDGARLPGSELCAGRGPGWPQPQSPSPLPHPGLCSGCFRTRWGGRGRPTLCVGLGQSLLLIRVEGVVIPYPSCWGIPPTLALVVRLSLSCPTFL